MRSIFLTFACLGALTFSQRKNQWATTKRTRCGTKYLVVIARGAKLSNNVRWRVAAVWIGVTTRLDYEKTCDSVTAWTQTRSYKCTIFIINISSQDQVPPSGWPMSPRRKPAFTMFYSFWIVVCWHTKPHNLCADATLTLSDS